MTEHDKELEDYLDGKSPLSKAYREASGEHAPAHLDDAILAHARAEARKTSSWTGALAPVAVAATVILGVNLAWNLYEAAPVPPGDEEAKAAKPPPAPAARPEPEAARQSPPLARRKTSVDAAVESDDLASGERVPSTSARAPEAARSTSAAPPAIVPEQEVADAQHDTAATESRRIERLIAQVGSLKGAEFLIDGESFTPAQAAVYLRIQWREAAARVHTAEDFIEKCASRSPATGEPYRFRFSDGTVETSAETLRNRLR